MSRATVDALKLPTRAQNVLLPLLPFVAFSEPHEERQARLLALSVDKLRALLVDAGREELQRWPITNGATLNPVWVWCMRQKNCGVKTTVRIMGALWP